MRLVGTLVLLIGLIAASAALVGHPVNAQTATATTLRVVHASPDAGPLDLIVDGEVSYRRLTYGEATPYGSIPPGDHTFQLVPAGAGSEGAAPIFESTATVESGQSYIAVAAGPAAGLSMIVAPVTLDALDIDRARIRAINAAPDAGSLDVVANDDTLLEGVAPSSAADYEEIDLGTYDLAVQTEGSDEAAISLTGVTLAGGINYDIVVFATADGSGLQSLILTTIVSPPCALALGGLPADACITLINTLGGLGWSVDLYYNNVRVLESVGVGQRVAYTPVPTGFGYEVPITLVPAGTSAELAYTYRYAELDPGQAYQLLLLGTLENPAVFVNAVDLTPLPPGQARVRLVHGVDGAPNVNLVFAEGPALFSDVGFEDATEYVTVDAGEYTAQFQDAESGAVLYETAVTVEAGKAYDVVVFNTPEQTGAEAAAEALGTPAANLEVSVWGDAQVAAIVIDTVTFPRGGVLAPVPPGGADAAATPTT
jgi:hypothetical protein